MFFALDSTIASMTCLLLDPFSVRDFFVAEVANNNVGIHFFLTANTPPIDAAFATAFTFGI